MGTNGFQRHRSPRNIVSLGMEEGWDGFAGPGTQMHQDPRRAAADVGIFLFLHEARHGMHDIRVKETCQTQHVFGAPGRVFIFPEIIDQECGRYPVRGPGFDQGLGGTAADSGIRIALRFGDFPH